MTDPYHPSYSVIERAHLGIAEPACPATPVTAQVRPVHYYPHHRGFATTADLAIVVVERGVGSAETRIVVNPAAVAALSRYIATYNRQSPAIVGSATLGAE